MSLSQRDTRGMRHELPTRTSLSRIMSVLDAFRPDDQVVSAAELGRRTGLPRSTAHRLVLEMCEAGLLKQVPGGVQLGMRLFELGQLASHQRGLPQAALPLMEDLREATHATVHLAVLDGVEVVYVEILRAKGAPSLPSRVGGRLPAHATGVGKAILAFSPKRVVAGRIEAGLQPRSPYTIIAPGRLTAELETIRKSGMAFDREESGIGIVCAAAPVFGRDGKVTAALSVSGMSAHTDVERMGPAVRTAALALSRQLAALSP